MLNEKGKTTTYGSSHFNGYSAHLSKYFFWRMHISIQWCVGKSTVRSGTRCFAKHSSEGVNSPTAMTWFVVPKKRATGLFWEWKYYWCELSEQVTPQNILRELHFWQGTSYLHGFNQVKDIWTRSDLNRLDWKKNSSCLALKLFRFHTFWLVFTQNNQIKMYYSPIAFATKLKKRHWIDLNEISQ